MGMHRNFSGTITRATTDVTGSQVITGVGGKFSSLMMKGADNNTASNAGDGWSDGSIQSCSYSSAITILALLASQNGMDLTKILVIQDINGNGWSISLTSKDADGFTIQWTKMGAGLNITVKYMAIL